MKQYYLFINFIRPVSVSGPQTAGSFRYFSQSLLCLPPLRWLLVAWLGWSLTATAQFCPNGTIVAGGNGTGSAPNQLNEPYNVVLDGAGNLYVSDLQNDRVQKFTPGSTQGVTVAGGNGRGSGLNQFSQPQGLVFDAAGYLYVTDYGNHRVLKFPPNFTSATLPTVAAGGNESGSGLNQLRSPTTIAMDASGNLYVDDNGNSRIIKFPSNSTSATSGTVVAGGNGAGSGLNQIDTSDGLFVDAAGAIYVSDEFNSRIIKFPPNSTSATNGTIVAGGNGIGNGLNQFRFQYDVLVDGSGNIYVADRINSRIIKFPANSTSATNGTVVAGGLDYPEGLFLDAAGNLYVTEYSRVTRFATGVPVAITQQPASSSSVCAGASVSTFVRTSGTVSGYQWYRNGGVVSGQTSATLTLPNTTTANSGSYVAVVTGACNSLTSTAFNLTVNPPPTVNLSNNGPLTCAMTSVTLTASGTSGSTYAFRGPSGPITSSGNTASVNSPGTYTVTASLNGCTSTTTTSVTSNTVVVTATLSASPSTTLTCSQPTLTLTASDGDTYRFSPTVASQSGNRATVTQAGVYSVTATSTATGCTSTASITISQDNAAPSASLASSGPLSCNVTSVTLTASPGGQSYRFSDGATSIGTTNQATVTTAGVYSVTVLAGNGCSSVASTTVTGDQTAPTVSISPTSGTLTCASPSLTLTANTSAQTLRWSSGQTTPSITVNVAGTYSVTAMGSNGCLGTSNAVRIESAQDVPPATLVASGGLNCAVTSVTLTANAGDGLSYRFSTGATQAGNGNTATVNVAGTYSVTVTNAVTGCTNTASVVVSQDNSQPTVTITPTTATLTCDVPRVTLTANTMASSLTWSTGQTTPSISVSVAGTYSVSVTSANGCMAMAMATISGTTDAPTAPTLSASPATTTTNQPITVTANGCTGGTINWTALGGSGQANGNTYTLSQPGNYTLSASCSLNGCTSISSVPLSVQIRPGGYAITGVSMVNCQLIDEAKGGYQVQFTPQYAGQTNSPISFAVVNELAATTAPAPYSLRLYTDNPVITLVATQAGNGEARFAYNWLASCQSGTSPNQPPTTTGIPSQTILVGQGYQLQLTTYFSDPDGQALTFQASGLPAGLTLNGSVISGAPSQTGVSAVSVTALDPGGLQVSTSFQLTVNPMPVTPPSGFAIVGVSTVSCQVLSAGERRLTFTPQYAGVNGTPISFSVVNELVATTSPGPYSLNLYTDNPTITLSAQQGATVSTYRYNWLAVCNPAARVGSGEVGAGLTVRVLGNPVAGNTAEVEISGAAGQPVQLNLVDLQGKSAHTQRIEQAGAVERVSLPLGASTGILLLQVSTPTQGQQLKLLRTN